ncbi:cilia- and flagella-associated protein 46 isoform X2 [Salmo trutta]|uniref:Cilia and flagella associated protein 46 n=1 Tax=Salmo trutta TaxID=8032 RepID=A0A673XN59_SALTR|nr:cilia- and flagella-associated protein 46 isoform X2 [Salmo trutta]
MDLHIRQYLTKARQQKDTDALNAAYDMIREGTPEETASDTRCFCPELYVMCAEQALQLGCADISRDCLMMYFEGKPPANQFLCRAYLCQGQLESPQSFGSVEEIEKAVIYFLKAIEISKIKPRYHFLVFNASVLYFQMVRPLLRSGPRQHLVPTLTQVVKALEEVGEQDYSWRAQLMLHLVECLVDAGKGKEASSFAKATSDFIESHIPDLYPKIFSLQVRHKLFDFTKTPPKTEASPVLSVIYKMQKLKHKVDDVCEARKEDAARIKEIFLLLMHSAAAQSPVIACGSSPCLAESPSPIPPADRVAFLLELAFLALQLKHHQMAADCLRELKTAGVTSVGQCIMMECVQCDLDLQKKQEGGMKDYSKANVEAQLKVIGRLDKVLQSAVREGDAKVMQAVCASQWNTCLPLLQHNLRRNVKGALLKVAQVLEDTYSVQLEMRCQVHSELAVIEEEEGRLEPALLHLQRALLLDERGVHHERLTSALNLLQLRGTLYQTPSSTEDKAAMLIQQAKNGQPQEEVRKRRPMLVNAGLTLAPDAFQVVLDAESTAKIPSGTSGPGGVAHLSAKAQHHSACVEKVQGHLTRQGAGKNDRERVKLWAALAKTARKQEVWDVCRAACRFCLLYDDGRWKAPKSDCEHKAGDESPVEGGLHGDRRPSAGRLAQSTEKDLLRLLAEVCFINAEATIHKLRSEGVQLNTPAAPPEERGLRLSEDNPQWAVYRDWIQDLSAYATSNFLRGAELGAEIREAWVVVNAAVYLWNYNSHLVAAGEQRRLLPTFQRAVELLRQTGHAGEPVLLVMLCDAVSQGLIQPWSVPAAGPGTGQGREDSGGRGELRKKGAGKGAERTGSIHSLPLDHAALQDMRKALELCDYALHLSNGNVPGESVPIAARKQVISTWVWTKRLLQQQIGQKLDIDDECKNEAVSAMTRVLVGVEMLLCNSHPRQIEFSVPSLSTLVRMASDCKWSDPVVELQVWTHLACFSHQAQDHNLVMTCSHNALQLEAAAAQRLKVMTYALYSRSAVQEMLSNAACLRGLSMVHKSNGHPHSYREALQMLQSSVSYAERAGNSVLCMATARHYWNNCLPLTETSLERQQLRQPLEKILKALVHTSKKYPTQGEEKGGATLTVMPSVTSSLEASSMGSPEDDLTLRAAMYGLLFHIHADSSDWTGALTLLEQAIRDMPRTRHRLLLFKHRVLVKARLGESVVIDMQKFRDEGELYCSHMWHRVALCSGEMLQQLACFQNSITSLLSVKSQWQKADFLLEFGEWLYCQNFPLADAQHQIQWAIDILLHMITDQEESKEKTCSKGSKLNELERRENSQGDESGEGTGLIPVKVQSHIGVQGAVSGPCFSDLREVRRLDSLVRAHTLLAAMGDRASPQHQQNLLRAYSLVMQIWQVSMATAREVIREMKNPLVPPSGPCPSATAKKDKDKEKDKGKKSKEPPPTEEKPKARRPQDDVLPSSPEEWAQYDCPEDVRQAFRYDTSPHCINRHSLSKQTQSLFFLDLLVKELQCLSLTHLTLPILHLAEVIAHDLLDRRSLSDLYRLRIVRSCSQLDMETSTVYHKKLLSLTGILEQEQMECRKAIALQRERNSLYMDYNGKTDNEKSKVDHICLSGKQCGDLWSKDIWLDKAEICLSMGLYQPARQLLAEAHLVAKEMGDQAAAGRSLLSLAILANKEQNHSQALALLEKAQDMGGDEDFWYKLTLALLTATVTQRGQDTDTKTDQIVKQGCGALKSMLEKRRNRAPVLRFLITSLESRGAVERLHAASPVEPGEALSTQSVQNLMAACDSLRASTSEFFRLGHREQAAEALLEHAQALRILAKHTDDEGKLRHLLDAYSFMQQAVSVQEHVVLNAQSLFPSQECQPLSLPATRRLLQVRLALAELSLAMLEQVCAEENRLALAQDRKASVERTVEEFVRITPDLGSVEQEWITTGRTLGQVALSQLATVNFMSLDCVETRASSLSLMGKCLRLLAMQRDPLYPFTLWDGHNLEEDRSESKASPKEEEELTGENGLESSRTEPRQYAAKCAELQRRRRSAQQLLAQASETLAQAISLSLQHKLPSSILSEACLNMLECHGQFDPCATGQYLALLQSCSCTAMMADILRSACTDTRVSQLSALLNLHSNLLPSQEETPTSLLKRVEDSLNGLSKTYSHLTINPSHLSLLGELPSNLKILLLQHTQDRSTLYGAFYERSKLTESQRGKAMQVSGMLVCTRVAKVAVQPRALLDLRNRTQAFKRETKHNFLKEAHWLCNEGRAGSERHVHLKSNSEEKLESHFKAIVQEMEDYLCPILSQFDFSCFRHQMPSISIPESIRPKEKEEKAGPDKGLAVGSPAELGEYVVLLADWMLMELPLEALAILQEEGLSSVSRDFSLQLLHTRLQREEPVESDNKKETKGGKGAKGKVDQSKAIKMVPVNRVLPPNTLPVDTHNFKYIIDPYNEEEYEGSSLTERMKRTLEAYSQQFTPLWEGFLGSECTPSLAELEQLLTNCSAFIFHGMERFLANIPPSKLAALNLSECQMAVLFDLVQNSASMLRQSKLDVQKSDGHLALERPLETALLLTLSGVRCVLLNQWHSSPQRNINNMDSVMENLLRVGLTSGQTVHALRKGEVQRTEKETNTAGADDTICHEDLVNRDGNAHDAQPRLTTSPSAFNCVIYGLPNLVIT